jgi:hypothetical protein
MGSKLQKLGKTLTWPFIKKEIEQILGQVERQ